MTERAVMASKSFSIDLNYITLSRSIGLSNQLLQRKIDRMDVISILLDEGYNNIVDQGGYVPHSNGEAHLLRELIRSKTIGVPVDSLVNVKWLGNNSRLLVTFSMENN